LIDGESLIKVGEYASEDDVYERQKGE